ncbi:hypothetical protein RDI58_000538 [Solanum bulbocastanum]|uniref:Uncharacterized protein n=1 Tax=Solanum bulbocastanum TaxID=147425 RepID=A0AAN8YP62_SOLBU
MCVTVFAKDYKLFYRNIQEEWVGRCGLDGGDTADCLVCHMCTM